MKLARIYLFFIPFFLLSGVFADTPSDDAEPEIVQQFSEESERIKEQYLQKYAEASQLIRVGADDEKYLALLDEVKMLKKEKEALQEKWRKNFATEAAGGDESYALWDMGETTLSQLIMEYGASDYLYVIPPELSAMKISLFSNIPLPRDSWGEMMEMILSHNGVGVKPLNPWVKQLYMLKLDPVAVGQIISREEDLALVEPQERLFFVFSPKAEQTKSIQSFFERFSDPRQTTVHSIASKIVLVANRETIEKLLGLYHAVWEKGRGKVVRLINLTKIAPAEVEKVLRAVFGDSLSKTRASMNTGDDLSIMTLPQGLVLAGEEDAVLRGEKIAMDLEKQLEDPGEKVVFWYACKYSNPEDIASVLMQVYDSLIGAQMEKRIDPSNNMTQTPATSTCAPQEPCPVPAFPCPNTVYNPVLPGNPNIIQPGALEPQKKSMYGNFIVDPKTASILMVVRREELPKIKSLLKRIDVPKRMVQIDVLLVEKKMTDRSQVGINLLNINSNLKFDHPNETGISFDTQECSRNKGLLQFLLQRSAGKWPGIDLTFNFLIAQDDVRINANPTVLAINQTPAQIAIVEEISINNGAIQNTSSQTVAQSYTRAQYGTTIVMLPTIHLPDLDENPDQLGFVSLHTDVTFDTTEMVKNDRPPVTKRHIINDVQIADGETVILGGLRRKMDEDRREKIPFLGDLPGIGKLFGADRTNETNTEMFIFITPHIVREPIDDLRRIRQEEYQKRAGDIPEFLLRLDEAKEKERKSLFANSMKMLFGKV